LLGIAYNNVKIGEGMRFPRSGGNSGLVLSLASVHSRRVDTTPARTWAGAGRTAAEQSIRLIAHR
jgi:hypothetical protein